jgi:hypothetical protein
MSISLLAKLYRESGTPEIEHGRFTGQIKFSYENKSLIQSISELKTVNFPELSVDGKDVDDPKAFPENGKVIEYTVTLPTSSANRFYTSIKNLVETSSQKISKGGLPEEFYIIENDYCYDEENKISELEILKKICGFIKQLSEIAHYHDSKNGNNSHRLVFVLPDEALYPSPVVMIIKVESSMLTTDFLPDLKIIDELCNVDIQPDPHYTVRKNIFYSSLAEFFNEEPSNEKTFAYLLNNWSNFSKIYQNNIATYLSGFAFHKAKKEVAEAELKIAEEFSKVISGITGKILSIPLSLVFVVTISKSNSMIDSVLLMVGLLLTSIIVAISVANQQRQLERIKHAKDVVLNAFEGKKSTYPPDLQDALNNMKINLNKNKKMLEGSLIFYRVASWLPCIIGITIFYCTFGPS